MINCKICGSEQYYNNSVRIEITQSHECDSNISRIKSLVICYKCFSVIEKVINKLRKYVDV